MTIETWRQHVRKAHGLASTGDRAAVDRLAHLMRHKRNNDLKSAQSTKEHSDDIVWNTFIANDRSRLMTALKLGYSMNHLYRRLRPILKSRTLNHTTA